MTLDPVDTLSRLVAVPSVNPMGGDDSGPEYGEARLTDLLESIFAEIGVPCRRQTVHPGRENLIACLEGEISPTRGGPLILFGAHQDTVPTQGMTIDPWTPRIHDDRLYGRGACDVKGGMAAMLAALAKLAQERPPGMPTIVMASTVNEEYGFTGAEALACLCEAPAGGILPRKPDAAVIAEPTDLQVVVAHKGVVRWRCHASGRAGHSARPEAGENAIYRMARAVTALAQYHAEVLPAAGSHKLCGEATLSVGTIRGGVSVNTIPDHCSIEIDRRLRPDEEPPAAYAHLVDYLAQDADLDFPLHHDPPYMQGQALSDDANGPLARRLADIVRQVTGDCQCVGVPYATDGARLAAAGIPTVIFGPGSVDQAHTEDEWLPLAPLRQAAEILYRFGCSGAG